MERRRGSRVTVSLPFYQCRPCLRRAVDSILKQTHRSLILVVVNDGDLTQPWDLLADIADPRLVRFDLTHNRGRYFADAAVVEATDDPYLLIQDADDWSEPERLARLLRALREQHASGALSAAHIHCNGPYQRSPVVQRDLVSPPTARFVHRADHVGLYRVDALREIGGYYGGFRVGYDTLLVNLLLMVGRLAYTEERLYNVELRAGSLTTARATGTSSRARAEVARKLSSLYDEAYAAYCRYVAGEIERPDLVAVLRALTGRHVSAAARAALAAESARLRAVLQSRAAEGVWAQEAADVPEVADAPATAVETPSLAALLSSPALRWTSWSIAPALAGEIVSRLQARGARRIIEVGSGVSTVALAWYAAQTGAEVVSLEHDPQWLEATRAQLAVVGLADAVRLCGAPLVPTRCADGGTYPWYDLRLEGTYDFALIDGPPGAHGRQAALFALWPSLTGDAEVWLHDAARPHEQACVDLWGRFLPVTVLRAAVDDPQGVFILGRAGKAAGGLAIALVARGGMEQAKAMVDVLAAGDPQALRDAEVIVVGAGDGAEASSLGAAMSRLAGAVLECGAGLEHALLLDDGWRVEAASGWLDAARSLLRARPEVGQVRLRHRGEPVLDRHMLTRKHIEWQQDAGGDALLSPSAHFTFNPSLLRVADLPALFPSVSERAAQEKFLRARWWSAQLVPGVFRSAPIVRPERARKLIFFSMFNTWGDRERVGSPAWTAYRFRFWQAHTLPSILGQADVSFEYWMLCADDLRHLTDPLFAEVDDPRVRVLTIDACTERLRALGADPSIGEVRMVRIDSDDLYDPSVGRRVLEATARKPYLQLNRGYALSLASRRLFHWDVRSSPFHVRVYSPEELRTLERWSTPDHSTVRRQASELSGRWFMVLEHEQNTSTRLERFAGAEVTGAERARVLATYGVADP